MISHIKGNIVTIIPQQFDHVIGVDTHAKTHTLVILDRHGVRQKSETFPTNPAGLNRAHNWITRTAPGNVLVAMEGTGSYGAPFAELLHNAGICVTETKPPKRGARRAGKSDTIDAEHAARHALTLPPGHLNTPRRTSGNQAALRVLLTARYAVSKHRTETLNQLTALLRTHRLGIDARHPLTTPQIRTIASWRTQRAEADWLATIRGEAILLARSIENNDQQLARNHTGLTTHVTAIAGWLLQEKGIGPVSAAQLIISWGHPGRIRSEAAFARLAGAAPIPASSGNITRYRLHRGGDRSLNKALWTIANSRLLCDEQTKAYLNKRISEGKTRKETLRCLKRYIARATYRKLENPPQNT